MSGFSRIFAAALAMVLMSCGLAAAQKSPPIQTKTADVNGIKMSYLIAGKGDPVILLHGYAQTSHMWRPLMAELATTHTVIAPDLRGFGATSKPADGYDKKSMAQDVRALVQSLGFKKVGIAGHDIGLMVAYAYAAQYPDEVSRIALMDAFLPGVGDWNSVFLLRDLWHFHFFGPTAVALVRGREKTYLEHFWNDFAADPKRSVREADRRFYAREYARKDGMRAGFEVFRAFPQDAKDFSELSKTKLTMPMLVLTGEKASGEFLITQARMVADNVDGVVIKGAGHWLIDEEPNQTIPKLVAFFRG